MTDDFTQGMLRESPSCLPDVSQMWSQNCLPIVLQLSPRIGPSNCLPIVFAFHIAQLSSRWDSVPTCKHRSAFHLFLSCLPDVIAQLSPNGLRSKIHHLVRWFSQRTKPLCIIWFSIAMLDYPRALSSSWFSILQIQLLKGGWCHGARHLSKSCRTGPYQFQRRLAVSWSSWGWCRPSASEFPSILQIWSPYGVFQMISGESNGDFRLQELKCPSPLGPWGCPERKKVASPAGCRWSSLFEDWDLRNPVVKTWPGEIHDYSEVGGPTYLARPAPKKMAPWELGSWLVSLVTLRGYHVWNSSICGNSFKLSIGTPLVPHWYPICAMVSI